MANLLNCNILFTNGSNIFAYDFDSNISTDVSSSISNLNTSLPYIGITHSNETIFLVDSSTNKFLEFFITAQTPFFAGYVREILPDPEVDNWYAVPKTNPNVTLTRPTTSKAPNLIVTISGDSVVEWIFSSNNLQFVVDGRLEIASYPTTKFSISNGNGVKDIFFSRQENILICVYGNAVKIYDYASGNLITTVSSPTITNIIGYFSNNFVPYVITENGQIYQINFNLGTFTLIKTIPNTGGGIVAISQAKECTTVYSTNNIFTNTIVGTVTPITPLPINRPLTVGTSTFTFPWNIGLNGTKLMDPNFSIMGNGNYTLLTANSVWKYSNNTSPLLRSVAVVNPLSPPNLSDFEGWAGYSITINASTTKTYYIGCGGTQRLWVRINGDTLFETNSHYISSLFPTQLVADSPGQEYTKFWHIYPFTVPPGSHTVELLTNGNNFGFEIYDNTYSQLVNATSVANLNIIFTTASKIGSYFDIVYSFDKKTLLYGNVCPDGYVYSSTLNACIKYSSTTDPVYVHTEVYGPNFDICEDIMVVTQTGVNSPPSFNIFKYKTNLNVWSSRYVTDIQPTKNAGINIGHTQEKYWTNTSYAIYEYKIHSLKPFFAAHRNTIQVPNSYVLGKSLAAISGNTLISNVGNNIVEIEIFDNSMTVNNKFAVTPTINTNQLRDISYSPNGKIVCTFDDEIIQYDYFTGTEEIRKSLANYWASPSLCVLPIPQGVVYTYNGINLVNECGFFYPIGSLTGNTFNRIFAGGTYINGLSQTTDCSCIVENTNIVISSDEIPVVSPPSYLVALEPPTFFFEYNQLDAIIYDTPYSIMGASFVTTTRNTPGLWKNVSGNEGPLKRTIVWTNQTTATNWGPTEKWIGFSECINIPVEKTYYVGMGGDDTVALIVNGETIVKKNAPTADNYRSWHIYPVRLKAGINTFEFLGANRLGRAGFGFEIYDNTKAQLISATNIGQLNIIFSTANKRGDDFNVVREAFFNYDGYNNPYVTSIYGYTTLGKYCPDSYTYKPCTDNCVKFEQDIQCLRMTVETINCDPIIVDGKGSIYTYNYQTNTTTDIKPFIVGGPTISICFDVAHTNTKLWVIAGTTGNIINEYDILSLSPFNAVFNRSLTSSSNLRSLAAINNNKLITSIAGNIVELDITGSVPTPTIKFSIPPTTVINDILFIPQDRIICTFSDRLIQYNYNTSAIESVIIFTTITNAQTTFVENNNYYVIDSLGDIYLLDLTLGGEFLTQNIPTGFIAGSSQLIDCTSFCLSSNTTTIIGDLPIAPRVALESVKPIEYDENFTINGTLIYTPGYNYDGTGIVSNVLTQNNLWRNNNGTNGPIDRCIVWSIDQSAYPYTTPWQPELIWVGFSETITSPTTKTYYFGMAGNDFVALRVNGNTVLNLGYNKNALNSGFGWYNWRIYPVVLNAGDNIIEFLGCNLTQDAGFGFEVYDNTLSELISANNIGDLNIIFTTASKQGTYISPGLEYFDVSYDAIELIYNQSYEIGTSNRILGYRCSDGFIYDSSDGNCKAFVTTGSTSGCTGLQTIFIPPGITINPCDTLYIDGQVIFHYDFASNTSTDITSYISGYIVPDNALEIAHTTNKMWVCSDFTIDEYDINSFSPFSATYNRTIVLPPTAVALQPGLTALDDTTLIGAMAGNIIELDLTNITAIVNNIFLIPLNKKIVGLMYFDSKLTCNYFDTTLVEYTVTQHDYPSGTIVFDYTLPPTIICPTGLLVENSELYVSDLTGELYKINTTTPFSTTFIQSTNNVVAGMSQISGCTVFSLTANTVTTPPPPCEFSALTVTGCTDLIIISISTENINCLVPYGSLTVSITGGCAPYTYTLLTELLVPIPGQVIVSSATTVTFTGLSQGTYYVNVLDCDDPSPIVSTQPGVVGSDITLFVNVVQLNSQQVCVTITGGTLPYNVVLNGVLVTWDNNNQTNCYDVPCEEGQLYYQITDSCEAQYSSITTNFIEEFIIGDDTVEVIYHLDKDPRIDGTNLYDAILTSDDIIYGFGGVPRPTWQGPGYFNPLRPAMFTCNTLGDYSVIKRFDCTYFNSPVGQCSTPIFSFELNSGDLYGSTFDGGIYYGGTIFKSDRLGNISFVKNFTANSQTEGSFVTDVILSSEGLLYTTLWDGGIYGASSGNTAYGGTIVSSTTQGQLSNVLYSFDGTLNDGYRPGPAGAGFGKGIVEYGNKLYGITTGGGIYGANPPYILGNVGVLYSIDKNGQNYSILHNFGQGQDVIGQSVNNLQIINGKIFGIAADSFRNYSSPLGLPGDGALFSCETSGSGYEIIRYFRDSTTSQRPITSLYVSNEKLYGTVWDKTTASTGRIFKFDPSNRAYSTTHTFSRPVDGTYPRIIGQASDNYVYGISLVGGSKIDPTYDAWGGTIWRFCPEGLVCRKVTATTENIVLSNGNCCSAVTTTETIEQEITIITANTISAITTVFSAACLNGIDVVFSLDYTGSMGPGIQVLKNNISSIVTTVANLSNNNYRFGLVLFDEAPPTATILPSYNLPGTYYTNSIPNSQKYINSAGTNKIYITAVEVMSLNNLASFINKLNLLNTSAFPLGTGVNTSEPSDISLEVISPQPRLLGGGAPNNFAGAFRTGVSKYIITITDALSSGLDDNFVYTPQEFTFGNDIANKLNSNGIKHILWRSFPECPLGAGIVTCVTDPLLTLTRNNNGYYVSGFSASSVTKINQILTESCASGITYTSSSIVITTATGYSTTTIYSSVTNTTIVGDCCIITGITQFSCITPTLILTDYLDPTCINDGYITVLATGGTPTYSITATNVTTNQQFIQNGVVDYVTFSNLLAGTYNIVATDSNGLVTNVVNTTLVNSFQIGIIQTLQTSTGTTYCFIVQGSNANTVQVTVDDDLFFTANTGVLTCFDIPINDCGILHTIQVVEIVDYEEGALLVANDGVGCDPASQIVKTGTTINGRPSYSFLQNGQASLIYWDTTIVPNKWILKNTITNTICATLPGSTNPLLQNYPIGNTTNWQFTNPTPTGCTCFRGAAEFNTGYIIYPGCSDEETFFVPCPDLSLNIVSITNPACNCDGLISLEATGGTQPYTFTLTDNISYTATNSTGVFTNLCEGTYYPSVYDNSLTALTATISPITLVSSFNVTTQVISINSSANTATFCITISGGSGSYTIQIYDGPFPTSYPAIPGTYCFELSSGQCFDIFVVDNIYVDCEYSANVCIPSSLLGCVSNSYFNPTCGGQNGTITVTISGGSPDYIYTLYDDSVISSVYTTNSTTHTFTGITGGTYVVTISDDTGTEITCFSETIAESQLNADVYSLITCEPIGEYCVSLSGGVAPYTVFDGINTYTISGDGIYCYTAFCGTYTVSITDSSSCQYEELINILCGLQITGTTTLNSCGVVGSGSVTIYTIIGGTSPYEYSFDGGLTYYNIPLIGGNTFSSEIFGSLFPGNYTFIVRDASGCTASTEVNVTENPVVTVSATTTPESCNYDNSGTITIFASGGTSPYQYEINGGGYVSSNYFTGLTVGTYNISVLDANNCEGTTVVNVDPPIVFSGLSTPENCSYSSGGTITISGINGGTPPYQYSINGGTFTSSNLFTGLTNGTYVLTIQDASGCTATTTTLINPPIIIDAVSTNENCLLSSGATITANASQGTPPYQYSIDSGTYGQSNYFTGLTIGSYLISAIDISGCSATTTVNISAATPIEITAITANATCLSIYGSIFVLANGGTPPYEYSIDNGVTYVTSPYFPDLIPSSYYIIVKDLYGCSASTFTEVISVPVFTISATTTPENCDYSNAGTLTVNVSGGTPTFQYEINGGGYVSSNYFTGLTVGTYLISVLDSNGCESTTTAIVEPPITVSTSGTPENCDYSSGATLTINGALGGTPPYQYSLNGGSFTSSNYFTGLTNGTYTITILDSSGCTATTTTLINPPIVISAITTSEDCFISSAGTITAIASEGTSPYQYAINGGTYGTSNYFTGLTIGSYLIGAIDISGCSATTTVNISAATPIDINAIVVNESCFNNGSGSILLTPINGVAPYQYSLTGGLNFTNNGLFTGLTIGTYDAVVIDLFGCSASTFVTVSAATPIVVNATSFSGFSCTGLTPLTLTMSANGGSPPYTYLWQPYNVPTQSINVNNYLTSAGTYTFTGITYDRFGCSGTTTITFNLTPAQIPTLTIYSAGTLYCDGSQFVTLSAAVNTTYSQISWSNGQTGVNAISATTPGNYYYVIQESGCTYSSSTVVVDYPTSIPPEVIGSIVLCPCSATTLTLLDNGEIYTDIQWNTLETGNTITVSSCTEGSYDYYVTALDIYGCTVTSNTVTVTYVALDVNIFTIDATCCSCGDGYAEVQILSGFGPFIFEWIGTTSTTNVAENLLPGTYTVNITDSTGCFASYTFDISCADVLVCIYNPVKDENGLVVLNPDGTVSFFDPGPVSTERSLRVVSVVPEECCIETSSSDLPLQFCNGKCYWNLSGCTEDAPDKILLGINQSDGILLPNNTTTGITESQVCQYQVSFDYLFNFDCESLIQCVAENYSGNVLTFLSGLSASATIEVLTTGGTYVTEQIFPIWKFNFYDQPTGVYFTSISGAPCVTLNDIIVQELGSNCTALTENTFAVIWRTASFKLYDSLMGKTIKLGLLLNGFNCDYNLLIDNIKIEEVCIISTDEIFSDSDCPGFDLVKVIDNKKSWVYNETLYNRDWFNLNYRNTSYDDYHERLDINTKEVDLNIDPSRAIEYDMYCYALTEPCFLGQDCNFPQLAVPVRRPRCFTNGIGGNTLWFQTISGLTAGETYDISFNIQATGFGGPTTLLVGVADVSGGTQVPLVDNFIISSNGNTTINITGTTLPSTLPTYNYLFITATNWADPIGVRRFCISSVSIKKYCDPADFSLDDFITINSGTTFDEFVSLIQTELIDVKDRQSISEYATLQYMYEKYLGLCGINNCNTQSNQYTYSSLNTFTNLIGGYWNNLIEQFVPATTIWKGGSHSYRNGSFHQPKFEYRNFGFDYCVVCLSGTPQPSVYERCYLTLSDKTLQLTQIGFSGLANTIAIRLNPNSIKNLFLGPTGCVYENGDRCCTTTDCFVSGLVKFNFQEGTNTYSATTSFSDINNPPTSASYLNIMYNGLNALGYTNQDPYNNFEWSTQDTQNCGLPIAITTELFLTYSCYTSTTVVTTATTGDVTYQVRFNNFVSSNMTPVGRFAISGGTILYGAVTDLVGGGEGYIYSSNLSSTAFNVVKSFNLAVDGVKNPASGLILAPDGYLYGTTLANNITASAAYGALYRINPTTNAYQTLRKFTIADGGRCWLGQELVFDGTNNRLYIPLVDGSNCSIFAWNLSTQTGFVLRNFGVGLGKIFLTLDGPANKLYGVTSEGGIYGRGSIFTMNLVAPYTPNTIHSFNPGAPVPNNVITPAGALVKDTSNVSMYYGLTSNASSGGYMSIYRIDVSSGVFNTIYTFAPPHTAFQGLNPQGDLIYQNNYLYGVCTTNGPFNYGTLFRFNLLTNNYSTFHLFGGAPFTTNDAAYSIRFYGNLQYNPTDNFFYGVSPLDIGTTTNNGQIYRFNFTGGTATASTVVTGVALYTCDYFGIEAGTPPITWEKTLVEFSAVTGITLSGCVSTCADVEVIVEDITNSINDPCKEPEIIERCGTIYLTHIDDDIWHEGTVTVTKITGVVYGGDPDVGPIATT